MTMPQTAETIRGHGGTASVRPPDGMTDGELHDVMASLRADVPGAIELIEQAVVYHRTEGRAFSFLSRSPADLAGGKAEWDRLVGYVARLFASPFVLAVKEYIQRQHGYDVAFVNCCIIAVADERIDMGELFALQVDQQITPDC